MACLRTFARDVRLSFQRDRRRFISPGTIVLYMIVLGFASAGFWKVQAVQSQTIASLRDGCEGVNALRVNQGLGIQEQIVATERSLRGSLGTLEPFRAQVIEGLTQRRARLRNLRATIKYPLTDDEARHYPAAERPYREDCTAAFP